MSDNRYQQSAFYVDSPMAGSIDQFYPFFQSGFFDPVHTQIIMRKRVGGPDFSRFPAIKNISRHKEARLPSLALREDVIFYSFNSKSNVSMMANRSVKHALILHGESNKISSCRPMARMYDFVCIPGEVSRDRYLSNRIFTSYDVERGRLIMTGDTFIQTIDEIRSEQNPLEDSWILYAPTWENGSVQENYSSAVGGYGFDVAMYLAEALLCRKIVIKLHPNFGKKDKSLLAVLQAKIREMYAKGFQVRLLSPNLDRLTTWKLRLKFGSELFELPESEFSIRMALVDISGMEAICLKQKIPHLVIKKASTLNVTSEAVNNDVYPYKTIEFGSSPDHVCAAIERRLKNPNVDEVHRRIVFGYSIKSFEGMLPNERNFALVDHIKKSDFWN